MRVSTADSQLRDCAFRSAVERETAMDLEAKRQRGEIAGWEYEKHYQLVVNGRTVCEIIPDFTVYHKNGRIQVVEVKGGQLMKTKQWALKRKLFMALNPHIEYVTLDKFKKKTGGSRPRFRTWDKFARKWVPPVIRMD